MSGRYHISPTMYSIEQKAAVSQTSCLILRTVFFAGNNIDDAIADAFYALDVHLEFQVEKGKTLPVAMPVEAHFDNENCQGGYWAFVDIDLSKYDGKAVKLNITLPQNLLNKIDSYVELHQHFGSRSGFIAEIARRELKKNA